jgi:transcriptional regulator with XRE-family HTH domain
MSSSSLTSHAAVPERRVTAVNEFVGARVRERRTELGLSSRQFAEKIDLSMKQLLNYERGFDRMTAGRLYEIACALNTPIDYFYEGFDDEEPRSVSARRGRNRQLDIARHLDEIHDEQYLEVISHVTRVLAQR